MDKHVFSWKLKQRSRFQWDMGRQESPIQVWFNLPASILTAFFNPATKNAVLLASCCKDVCDRISGNHCAADVICLDVGGRSEVIFYSHWPSPILVYVCVDHLGNRTWVVHGFFSSLACTTIENASLFCTSYDKLAFLSYWSFFLAVRLRTLRYLRSCTPPQCWTIFPSSII